MMNLATKIKRQLAAKALQRQLGRVAEGQAETFPAGPSNELLAQTCDFDRFPGALQVRITEEGGRRFGLASPFFRAHEGIPGATTRIEGRDYVNFASYNYLGLNGDPRVIAKAVDAIHRYGTSAAASRMVAGERPIHRELEAALAAFYETDDCLAFVSGHATNVTTIGFLFGPRDLIIHDALAHNSILQGAALSGAKRLAFPHNDCDALEELLGRVRKNYQRALVVVEGLYSMDGDFPDLRRLVEIKRRHSAILMVDEAHSLGVMGETGRGLREHCGVDGRDVDIWMGTLSKTLAGCGGFIAGSKALVEQLRYLAPGFLYSVGMSPPLAASALAALEILRAEPQRVATLHRRGRLFLDEARRLGLDTGTSAGLSIVPIIAGSSLKACEWANRMFEHGVNVMPIFYPAVEEQAARLRFFVCSDHSEAHIRDTVATLGRVAGTSA